MSESKSEMETRLDERAGQIKKLQSRLTVAEDRIKKMSKGDLGPESIFAGHSVLVKSLEKHWDELRDQLATADKQLTAARKQIIEYEQTEAAVCPEDVGIQEYVKALLAQITAANKENKRLEGIIVRFKAGCKITGKGPVDKDCEAVRLANEENKRLKEFTRHVINVECWSVDGADIQEKAEELGLIITHTVTEEEADGDFGVGERKFKFSDILKE